jgi:hypothetical protein
VPTTVTGRSLTSALLALMSATAALTSLIVDSSVALLGLRSMSSHPAGATKELNGLSRFPVRGEGGRMGLRDGAVYEGSLVGESGGRVFIAY